ncbi:glycosyltransferase, partial [Microgenomates group bacterium]|nr:glycosyltransferase [Microgenomates group bacterium]
MIKICTIILEFQNPKMTLATIASLKKAVIPAGFTNQIVIVDNSPVPDGWLEKSLKKDKNIKLITTLQNTGFAKGNNLGIKYGLKRGCRYFLLLNNDVLVNRHFLQHLLATEADLAVPK